MPTTVETVQFLRETDLFEKIPGTILARIASTMKSVQFTPGQRFITQGDSGDSLYLVVEGQVSIEVDGEAIARRGPGASLGEMSLLTGRPRSSSCVTVGDVLVLRLSREAFEEVMDERPELARGIIQTLAVRLDELSRAVARSRRAVTEPLVRM